MSAPSLSLIIPFRDDDGTQRGEGSRFVARWTHFLPDAEILVQSDDGGTPFSKTLAVNRAFARSSGEVIGMLDADVWVDVEHA